MSVQFTEWILSNAEKISLRVEDLQWVQRVFPGLHDIHVSIMIEGRRYEGRGSAPSKDLAIVKAVAEAVERALCLRSLPTTNGVAAHSCLEQAKQNALNELLERDLFLSHFLTRSPFSFSKKGTESLPLALRAEILEAGGKLQIFRMRRNSEGQGFVCLIRGGRDWGGILGLSFGQEDEATLITKAALEASRCYWHRRTHKTLTENHSLQSFRALSDWNYSDHGRLGLNVDYFSQISHLFPEVEETESCQDFVAYRSNEFSFRILENGWDELEGCPLKVVHCIGESTQSLLPGPLAANEVLRPGLLRFMNSQDFVLESLPHPID